MSATAEVKKPKGLENPFPDKISRRLTLEDFKECLLGHRVPKSKVHIVLDLVSEAFPEEGLPEKNFIPDF